MTICFILYQTLKSDVVYFFRPAYTYKFILPKNYAVKKLVVKLSKHVEMLNKSILDIFLLKRDQNVEV